MSTKTIEVSIAQPIPNVPASLHSNIIAAWEQADAMLNGVVFKAENPFDDKLEVYRLSMDLSPVVEVLRRAAEHEGGYTKYRQLMREGTASINNTMITIELVPEAASKRTVAYYHAAAVALQQLYLALNISVPGSCQIVDAKYFGSECSSFDPPSLEATPFIDAYLYSVDAQWPVVGHLDVPEVWGWLNVLETSETEFAIRNINKILFGLLELGFSHGGLANNALLVYLLLELLTDTTDIHNPLQVRSRIALILGNVSKEGDSVLELYRTKNAYIAGERPFRRHALRIHDFEEELMSHLCIHHSPVEEGVAIILALLQKLCANNGAGFSYEETVSVGSID